MCTQVYKARLFKGAPWWPGWGVTEDERVKIRRAEKEVLLATFTAEILGKAVVKDHPTKPELVTRIDGKVMVMTGRSNASSRSRATALAAATGSGTPAP